MNGAARRVRGLVLVTVLLSGAFVLWVGCQKKEPATPAQTTQAEPPQATAASAAGTAQVAEQTTCPVLADQPINKNISVEYKGRKVYFCCEDCKAAFTKDPEKYVKNLPQFKQ